MNAYGMMCINSVGANASQLDWSNCRIISAFYYVIGFLGI